MSKWNALIGQFLENVNFIDVLSLSVAIIALLLVIFYQYRRQKPILSFRIVTHYHYCIEEYNQLALHVEIAVDNVGERGTTIHNVELLNAFPSDIYKLLKSAYNPPSELDVPPHSTKRLDYGLASPKGINCKSVVHKKIDLELRLSWTHGCKIMQITTQCLKN